jgi:DNA-binding MarR family transcriptional regulator
MKQDDGLPGCRPDTSAMEARNIGYLFRDTHRAFRRIMKARIEAHGVTVAMWTQLWELWHGDGLTQSEIARRIKLEKPSVNSTIAKMEALGLVERRCTHSDRRERRVFLTPRAWAMRDDLSRMAAQINDEVLAELSDIEVRDLMSLLRRVNEAAREVAIRGGRPASEPTTAFPGSKTGTE